MIFASVVLGRGGPAPAGRGDPGGPVFFISLFVVWGGGGGGPAGGGGEGDPRGIQFFLILFFLFFVWIPACAGMTEKVFLGNKCEKFKNTLWIYKQVI